MLEPARSGAAQFEAKQANVARLSLRSDHNSEALKRRQLLLHETHYKMAENQLKVKTTSSKALDDKSAHILQPHNGAVRKMEQALSCKAKQSFRSIAGDWDAMDLGKNKLKRKKQLSGSLTSVGDTVNQEKRTRIEGIQLNCRGKLRSKDTHTFESGCNRVERAVIIGGVTMNNRATAAPTQRFKRKLQENLDQLQKMNALTEQLRLEINELKSSLITERGAVRALRAQNDADSRRWKSEVKKLQQALDSAKKCHAHKKPIDEMTASADGLINYEIQRLTNEIAALKEASRTKEDKCQLEEIKTKERNISLLRRDLQALQNGKKQTDVKLPTTKPKTNETSHKPKKATNATKTKINETDIQTTVCQAQVTSEITQLKNIELINNTRNVHKSLEMRTTKTQTALMPPTTLEEMSTRHEQIITNDDGVSTWMTGNKCRSLSQDVVCALFNKTTQTHEVQEYRTKDNNSDTDSALSSAPPSISPQPPSTGSDSGMMWQTMHSYSKDLEKLQKEVEMYHKENERLQSEMLLMKQELQGAEKAALAASNSTHVTELLERVKAMEEQELQLASEANELREQNELLEFRILELEDDKMDGSFESHCQHLQNLLHQSTLADKDRRCLQELLQCVQELNLDTDLMAELETARSEQRLRTAANSNTNSSPARLTCGNRIVATVQPYSNKATPSDSVCTTPRKLRQAWQSSSLSESGVFVECDFAGETEERQLHSEAADAKRLQYYRERLELLERKVLVYESSGETQAKHLADRLQREIQLDKELKELSGRVECLAQQNLLLEEEKCEFEEADNDSRLRLQRTEVELEILRQRNLELEFSKDALSAKYRDCRNEGQILREDLCAFEAQVQNLEADRRHTRQQLESLRSSVPLLLICRLLTLVRSANMGNELSSERPREPAGAQNCAGSCMANNRSSGRRASGHGNDEGSAREISYLKEEVKSLRCQIKDLNSRHYEAMETADSHWVDLEREYKGREEAFRSKEACLKQKIVRLQDCLRDDSRAAAEKIQQLEEAEQGLKTCLVRLTKEHRDLLEERKTLLDQAENNKAQSEQVAEEQRPLVEALESEKRRSQALIDDLSFSKKLQQNTEDQLKQETESLRRQIFEMKKDFMHIEVTNGELKEEVGTLEAKIAEMQEQLKNAQERERNLEDELRTKDELCQTLERKLGVCPGGLSLADELYDSPAKRARRDEVRDLQTASQGLGCALRDLERRERELPTHRDFQTIACGVKQLADAILYTQNPPEEEIAQL